MREKSGATSPSCRCPARAWVQRVSKGKSRNTTGPGISAITRPKVSGGLRIAHQMNAVNDAYTIRRPINNRTRNFRLDMVPSEALGTMLAGKQPASRSGNGYQDHFVGLLIWLAWRVEGC